MICRALSTPKPAPRSGSGRQTPTWVNADSAWMDMRAWDRCSSPALTLDDIKHLPCWVPLDLASKVDIAAAPVIAHDSDSGNFTKNLITIRAERRLALATERPAAVRAGDLTPA